MRRRAPGLTAASPLRRWPGAVVVAVTVATLVLAGSAALALVDGASADLSSNRAGLTGVIPDSGTSAAAAKAGADADEAVPGTDAVRTVIVDLYDVDRERAITVTVVAPAVAGSFPLVVFAHGFATSADTYSAYETELAEAGFVVAAPDFPESSAAVTSSPQRDVVGQAADVSFVIDRLLDPSTQPDINAAIDPHHVAVIGHSDGGVTAAALGFNESAHDPRIGAVVTLSGAATGFPGEWFTGADPPALLAIHGTADAVNPFAASQTLFDGATGTRLLVAVDGGTHTGPFVDDPDTVGEVAALTADFLHATLSGNATAATRLTADASTGSLVLAGA